MRTNVVTLILGLGPACGHAPAAPAIPPPASAAPMHVGALDDDDDWLDDDEDEAGARSGAGLASSSPGRCEPPPRQGVEQPDFGAVRSFVESTLRWTGVPSIAVAVARDDEILWEEGFGWADRGRRVRADASTMYSLASLSKPYTATAMMVLREQGKLRLDQPLSELLPPPGLRAGAGDPAQATVARVASHTAGLPTHHQFYYAGGREGYAGTEPPPAAITRERYAVLVSAPGEQYRYSNLGFGLLGEAVAQQAGAPFPEALRTLVLDPLGLDHTFVGRPPRRAGKTALRYDANGRPLPDYGFDHDGASAVYASAHDLVRFGMAHLGHGSDGAPALLSEEGRALMRTPVPPAEGYGLGWGLGRDDGVARVSHGGGMPGVSTAIRMFPEQGVVVVVLINSSAGGRAHVETSTLIEDAVGLPARSDDVCARPAGDPWLGIWRGEVEALGGPRPLALELRPNGEVMATLGDASPAIVRRVSLRDGVLHGWFVGEGGAEQGGGQRGFLGLELRLRDGERLDGGLTTHVPEVATTAAFVSLRRGSGGEG